MEGLNAKIAIFGYLLGQGMSGLCEVYCMISWNYGIAEIVDVLEKQKNDMLRPEMVKKWKSAKKFVRLEPPRSFNTGIAAHGVLSPELLKIRPFRPGTVGVVRSLLQSYGMFP